MEIWQLRCAVQVAEAGSMNRAAKELKTGQSAVSKTIKELETEIGCSLFVRTASGIRVTKQGTEFLMYARSILEQTDTLSSLYQPLSKKMEVGQKQVSFSIPQLEEMDYIEPALQRWFRAYGKEISRFSLSSPDIEEALSGLISGETNLAVFRIKNRDRLYWEHKLHTANSNADTPLHISTLWEFQKKILVHAHHPLASIHEIPFSALRQYSEIISDKNREPADGQFSVPNRSLVFSCLKSISGSYTFSAPLPDEILIRENLRVKEVSCENVTFPDFAPELFFQDIAVWAGSLDDACRLFLEYARQETASFL
ncbi:MAG: LysR family transcriptional regulator [bacterium]|nr:LysR family transcriptional regulator [bacterium]